MDDNIKTQPALAEHYECLFLLQKLKNYLSCDLFRSSYNFFITENNQIMLDVRNLEKRSYIRATINLVEKRVVLDYFQENEPTAFNIGTQPSLIDTHLLLYKDKESVDYDDLSSVMISYLKRSTKFTNWVDSGNPIKIKAKNCDISELHENEVIAFEVQSISELKDMKIECLDKTFISLESIYDKYKKDVFYSKYKKPFYIVYNIRRQVFLFTQAVFHYNFSFD